MTSMPVRRASGTSRGAHVTPWVSRSPAGGWTHWPCEADYRRAESRGYTEGRPATEAEADFAASLRAYAVGGDAGSSYRVAPWVQTASGRAVDLLEPDPETIVLADIAIALGRVPRFNGHTAGTGTWSVAAHSLLVLDLAKRDGMQDDGLLAALLHDAHEAYTGDVTSPMKTALRAMAARQCGGVFLPDPLRTIQDGLQRAVHQRFCLPWPLPASLIVKLQHLDLIALAIEREQLMDRCERPWGDLPAVPTDPPYLPRTESNHITGAFERKARKLMRHG